MLGKTLIAWPANYCYDNKNGNEPSPTRYANDSSVIKSADKFPVEVHDQLEYYVYRFDPRSGQTFYVGKGKGDRVFAHAKNLVRAS